MIEVSVERLDFYKSELERLLRSEFLETQVKNVHTVGLKWSEVHRVQTSAHPLHLWWKPFEQNIQESKSVGQLRLSEQALRLLNLLSDLLDIETVPGIDRILAGLKDKSTFYSSVYEAAVAASYKSLGYNVIVIPESSIPGQKTPDLAVNNEHGTVYVECKSLEDISIGEATMWDQALERLSKVLLGYRRNWIVRIRAGKQLESRDLERLIASITADIRSGRIESRQLLEGSFQVEYQFLCDPDAEFKAEGVEFDRGDSEYGTFGVQVSKGDTATKWRNPHAVFVHPHVELNLTKRLINEFKKASRQIPKGGPGIVHLQVPYRKGDQLLAVVDEAYNCIFRKLRSDTGRVNAVVISGAVMENQGLSPIVHNHFVVPNIKASSQLPFGFAVLGTYDMGIELPTVEGTIEFKFSIPEEWTEGIPGNPFFLLLVTD